MVSDIDLFVLIDQLIKLIDRDGGCRFKNNAG